MLAAGIAGEHFRFKVTHVVGGPDELTVKRAIQHLDFFADWFVHGVAPVYCRAFLRCRRARSLFMYRRARASNRGNHRSKSEFEALTSVAPKLVAACFMSSMLCGHAANCTQHFNANQFARGTEVRKHLARYKLSRLHVCGIGRSDVD